MIENPEEFWNTRWKEGQTGWDIGGCAPAFIDYFSNSIDKGTSILIPGCGNAHEADFLIRSGYTNITLIDIAPKAVERLNEKFGNNPNITIICGDFFKHIGKYDCIIEQTFFCAINPLLRIDYAEKVHQLLRPDGKIIAILFNRSFESGPPFGGSKAEYIQLFSSFFTIKILEKNHLSIPQRIGTELFGVFERK